jgi:hypothetical protein
MKAIVEKLRGTEKALAKAKGPFDLFAIFLREDAPEVWDLVVAASWIESDRPEALRIISKRVQQDLSPTELTKISRIVIVDQAHAALQAVTSAVGVQHTVIEVKDSNFFGLQIKEGFIITAQKRKAA